MVSRPAESDVRIEQLMRLTAEMVDIPSESFGESLFVDWLVDQLGDCDHLDVTRVGDNLVARTSAGNATRIILAGHTDTVPANGNATSRRDGDVLWGLGTSDMKGGLAVMLTSARHHRNPIVDVTYVFYAREEVAAEHSGLEELFTSRPDLLSGDVALLGEPTDGAVEAGCQGSLRARVTLRGARAHPARPWMGVNAVHRAAPILAMLDAYVPRRPVVGGCEFCESFLALGIEGGVSGNVVPDEVVLTVGHRFAPDRSMEEAESFVREQLEPFLTEVDRVEFVDRSPAAFPSTDHPVVASMVQRHGLEVRAKLGWTDVARFADNGVPAANFGPGDATLAHTPEERLTEASLWRCWKVIDDLARRA